MVGEPCLTPFLPCLHACCRFRFDADGKSFKGDEGRYTRNTDCPPARRRARLQELLRGNTPLV